MQAAIKGEACVLTCINGNDLLRDMVVFLEKLKSIGVIAVSHAPSIGFYEKDTEMYKVLTKAGITLDREIEMLKLAKEMGFVTFGQPFNIEDTHKIMEQLWKHQKMLNIYLIILHVKVYGQDHQQNEFQ